MIFGFRYSFVYNEALRFAFQDNAPDLCCCDIRLFGLGIDGYQHDGIATGPIVDNPITTSLAFGCI